MQVKKRTRSQFKQFRAAFKKWRAKWASEVASYSFKGPYEDGVFVVYDSKMKEVTRYIAPGYMKYMIYQFRGLPKKK